ncbi:MAG TPA: type I pullulanase [Bacillota bacterium]|nr:type I pullulanase [Bacillota bacterium]
MIKRLFLVSLVLLIGLTFVTPIPVGADPASPDIPSGCVRIHYLRPTTYRSGNLSEFEDWGLHAWNNSGDLPGISWSSPMAFTGVDDIGVYFDARYGNSSTKGFIIHSGDNKSVSSNQYVPTGVNEIWVIHGNATIYTNRNEALTAASITAAPPVPEGKLRVYYYNPDANGDYSAWGLHVWEDDGGSRTDWSTPMPPTGYDAWGLPYWDLEPPTVQGKLKYISHRFNPDFQTSDLSFDDSVSENWAKTTSVGGNYVHSTATSRMDCLFGNSIRSAVLNSIRQIQFMTVRELKQEQVDSIQVFDGEVKVTGFTVDKSKAPTYNLNFSSDLDWNKTYTVTIDSGKMTCDTYLHGSVIDEIGLIYGDDDLGATYSPAATTFKLWSPTANAVEVHIFNDPEETVSITQAMTKDPATGVWSTTVSGNLKNKFYQYKVTHGTRSKMVLDPYAKSMAAFNSDSDDKVGKAAIIDLADTNPPGWAKDKYIHVQDQEDVIIYEVSVRDFTIHKSSGVDEELRGTYLGFIKKIPHLKKLGVTHVQLMPVLNWYYGNEKNKAFEKTPTPDLNKDHSDTYGANYNWGYDPHNYFTPEGWYATDPKVPTVRIRELKQLIQALHKAGIGVILDVVYNHTAITDTFEDIVPYYYYRRNPDGSFTSGSGCGNDTASERSMFRKLMIDSATYWVEEFHVDGFRFDLQGLHDRETMQQLAAAVRAINPSINLHGEGWDMGTLPVDQRYTKFTGGGGWAAREMEHAIAHFSDGFRDGVIQPSAFDPWYRGGFVQRDGGDDEPRVRRGIVGNLSNDLYPSTSNVPIDSGDYNCFTDDPEEGVNYTNCHDGLTLRDKIWCSMANEPESEKIKAIQLASAVVLTSQGKVFFQGGDEILRSHPWPYSKLPSKAAPLPYSHNTHDMGDDVNHFNWVDYNAKDETTMQVFNYLRGLIALRKQHEAFRMETAAEIRAGLTFVPEKIDHFIAYRLQEQDGTDPWKDIYVFYNANPNAVTINIPGINNSWNIVTDDQRAGVVRLNEISNAKLDNDTITVPGRSCVVIHAPKGRIIQPQRRSFFWRFFREYFNR